MPDVHRSLPSRQFALEDPMDEVRFDALVRRCGTEATRRGIVRLLGGGILAGALGLWGRGEATAGCGAECPFCKRCRRRRCRTDPNKEGLACNISGKICQDGQCCTKEGPVAGTCTEDADCCSKRCRPLPSSSLICRKK